MLNLFDKKTKNTFLLFPQISKSNFVYTDSALAPLQATSKKTESLLLEEKIGETRHYPPASKEWINSVYTYNKNFTKTLPIADNIVNRLIKSYFSLSPLFKKKKSKRVEIRFRRLSLNRILVSKAEMKHTNNKVIITVYLYNKNKKFFLYKLKNLYKTFVLKLPSISNNITKIRKSLSLKSSRHTRSLTKKNNIRNLAPWRVKKNVLHLGNMKNYKPKTQSAQPLHLYGFSINKYYVSDKKNSKFSTKRSRSSNKKFRLSGSSSIVRGKGYNMKIYNLINLSNLTKNRFSKFILKIKNTNLKNKYKTIIKEYYSLLNKYKFYSINNNNYYLNYVNLSKHSNNNQIYYTSAFYNLLKNTFSNTSGFAWSTKRSNITFESKINKRKSSKFIINKYPRKIKNLMYKLRNLYKLFSTNNISGSLYNYAQNNNIAFGLNQNDFYKNIHRILKKDGPTGIENKARKRINFISLKGVRIIKKARKHKNFLLKTLKWNNVSFINYENKYYKNFIKKAYKKEMLYLYYVRMLSLNNNKFKNWFLLGLKNIISSVYNKKVEFNLVNLKYLHLNSDIFSDSIAIKLRNRQNRLLTVLKKALKLVKLPSLNVMSSSNLLDKKPSKFLINKYNTLSLNSFASTMFSKDALNQLLNNIYPKNLALSKYSQTPSQKSNMQKIVLNSIKHKAVFGVRLEATGRLSKRLTASRSVFKLKYKGSLKNIDSSSKGLSSVILRGNIKPNIQYTKISSKTRNGSFGLKGWVSGY